MKDILTLLFKPINRVEMQRTKIIYFASVVVTSLMFPAMQLLLSLTQKNLVNAIEYNDLSYMNLVYWFAGTILFLVVVVLPFSTFHMERSIYTFMQAFRLYAVSRLISFPVSVFEDRHTGDIVTRINGDIERLPALYGSTAHYLLLSIFYGGGSIVLMSFLSWPLALAIVILAVIETFAMGKISVKIRQNTEIIRERTGKTNELFFDIAKSLSFLRMASIGHVIFRKYRNMNRDIVDESIRRNRTILRMNAVTDFFEVFNLTGVLAAGIVMYFNSYIDLGSVMAFLILQDGVTYMFTNLRNVFGWVQQQRVNVRRVFEILDRDIEIDAAPTGEHIGVIGNQDIRIENLSFRYKPDHAPVLDNISGTIPQEKVTVVEGPSGGGKSTLAKLLLGLYRPVTGTIRIGEYDYTRLSLKDIRDHYSYVPQSVHLFYDTIENNIRCGNATASFEDVVQAARLAEAHDFIMEKPEGYRTMVQEHGTNLSGGEKQRIALARAILKDAPVLILDEATSAVDSKTESRIHDRIRNQAKQGKTVIMITHRRSADRIADNSIHIDRGTIKKG